VDHLEPGREILKKQKISMGIERPGEEFLKEKPF